MYRPKLDLAVDATLINGCLGQMQIDHQIGQMKMNQHWLYIPCWMIYLKDKSNE